MPCIYFWRVDWLSAWSHEFIHLTCFWALCRVWFCKQCGGWAECGAASFRCCMKVLQFGGWETRLFVVMWNFRFICGLSLFLSQVTRSMASLFLCSSVQALNSWKLCCAKCWAQDEILCFILFSCLLSSQGSHFRPGASNEPLCRTITIPCIVWHWYQNRCVMLW